MENRQTVKKKGKLALKRGDIFSENWINNYEMVSWASVYYVIHIITSIPLSLSVIHHHNFYFHQLRLWCFP